MFIKRDLSSDQNVMPTSLLRQRFSSHEQLVSHLHHSEGRTLFFFRSSLARLASGTRVVLEISFNTSDKQVVLRGRVLGAPQTGSIRGLWLEFPDTNLPGCEGLAARKQPRFACEELVRVRGGAHPHLGKLTDISMGGARLAGMSGVNVGEEVQLSIVSNNVATPGALGPATVARVGENEMGVRFLRRESWSRKALSCLFSALLGRWGLAVRAEHPPTCCRGGVLLEPPVPRRIVRVARELEFADDLSL